MPLPWTVDRTAITADSNLYFADGGVSTATTVLAPAQDLAGLALQTQIAAVQTLFLLDENARVREQILQQRNLLEVELVDHYMVTGWLNAATILAMYPAPAWDKVGAVLTARVASLQNLFNNAPAPLPGNSNGYGSSGWVTVAQNYAQQLYAAQISLVEHIMDLPGGTTAHTILTTMTGFQSFPFEYVFSSVGYTQPAG